MKFSEILRLNKEFRFSLEKTPVYPISVISNVVVNQLQPILEYELRVNFVNAEVAIGDYDAIIQDSVKSSEKSMVVLFWEIANLIDGFQYKAPLLSLKETEELVERFKSEIDFALKNLEKLPLVLFNKFSTLAFNHPYIKKNNFDFICDQLNNYIESKQSHNVIIIDIDKLIAKCSIEKSFDFRNYYSSKALYSVDFFREYASFIKPIVLSATGKSKKALIFDCDNTLWNGIVGEDGLDGIQMSSKTAKGVVFEEVQHLAKDLARKGIVIGLNSKNNASDVNEVFSNNKAITIKDEDIVIKKVNWNDKVSNLKEIAKDLNIGIDSLLFVDDSDFEINLVRETLPQVVTMQVPKQLYLYPQEFRKRQECFFTLSNSNEDSNRIKMYKDEQKRETEKASFVNIGEYLKSLDLSIVVYIDNKAQIARIAQLTQKTNQFNFTTKRYTETEITSFIESKSHKVFTIEVRDKFGDFGLTGVIIVEIKDDSALIDTFLMSCRVLGRNLELKFLDLVIEELRLIGIKKIVASYYKTIKNNQVQVFYENNGFLVMKQNEIEKFYELNIANYKLHQLDYISSKYDR
ncbi:MAG: HAD-IIIC family phosphatase [Bacteroidetes bacterium]|nr:HAD-IIIC family phosphatase [Bacteroidota bacterium]